MEDAMIDSDNALSTDNPPFKSLIVNGNYSFTEHGSLLLEDVDTWGQGNSGAVHFKVGKNWKMQVEIEVENNNYFQDFVNTNSNRIKVGKSKHYIGTNDSHVFIDMVENDWVSLDVDALDGNGIATMKIVLGGKQYANQSDVYRANDEAYFKIKSIEHFEEITEDFECESGYEYDEATGTCVPIEDYTGPINPPADDPDTDGDGIKDSLDPYPFDPTLPNNSGGEGDGEGDGSTITVEEVEVMDYGVIGLIIAAFVVGGIIYYAVRDA